MKAEDVRVPAALLLDSAITAYAKVIWIVVRLDAKIADFADGRRVSVSRLAERAGFARPTVRRALADLSARGWPVTQSRGANAAGRRPRADVAMPDDLVLAGALSPFARVLYGVLQRTPGFVWPTGSFTHAELGAMVGWQPRTAMYGARELRNVGWIELAQSNRRARIHFSLGHPHLLEHKGELAAMARRIEKAPFRGEALMRAYLDLLVDSDRFEDDSSPGFLVNPSTAERLQFDRYYPDRVAFEFNGPQHYGATERFPADVVAEQQTRDLIKTGICARRGIALVVVESADLTLATMRRKIDGLLPLRDLQGRWMIVNYLESASRTYRRTVRRLQMSKRQSEGA